MKKGFTMVELLATISLIAIIIIISFPLIISSINRTNDHLDDADKMILASAIKSCLSEYKCECTSTNCSVQVSELLRYKYITEEMLVNGLTEQDAINYTYRNNSVTVNGYEAQDTSIVCNPSTEPTYAGIGLIASSEASKYEAGTEYKCNAGDGLQRTFYVVSSNSTTVNLILAMNHGVGRTHINAKNYTNSILSRWTKVNNVTLPSQADILAATGTTNISTSTNVPAFLSVQMNCVANACAVADITETDTSEMVTCFWTDITSSANNYWVVENNGTSSIKQLSSSEKCGVRPVITVSKTRIGSVASN